MYRASNSIPGRKHKGLSDEDVALALAICGLNLAAFCEGTEKPEFKGISPEIEELANRCLATFHPDYNPELAEVIERALRGSEDKEYHYRTAGSVLRRLTDSCKHWSKTGGRKGYIRFVTSFLEKGNMMPEDDKVDFMITTRNAPLGLED